jgi:hypothetical protein
MVVALLLTRVGGNRLARIRFSWSRCVKMFALYRFWVCKGGKLHCSVFAGAIGDGRI